MAKISGLHRGRRGISIPTGIKLFQALIRAHFENAAPVWAGLSMNNMNQLEKLQAQCLRKILGVHNNSSANAVEVIAGVMPIRHRLRELCMREYCKIMARDEKDCLRQMIENASNIRNCFTPLSYLKSVSKNLTKSVSDLSLSRRMQGI